MASEALDAAGAKGAELAGIGITNQRETVVAWDRDTGEPLHRAIVWQDRRTARRCDELREAGHEPLVRERTGLVLDPYFSGTKIEWLIREGGVPRDAAFGTIDSWLVFKLTGRARDRLLERLAHAPVRHPRARAGTPELCDLLGVRPGLAARAAPERARVRRDVRVRRLGAGGGHRGRPAGGALRPGLPRARARQEHLRHRQLRAPERRRRGCPRPPRGCSRRSRGGWATGSTTRSRRRSS